jgi:CheY-like chemotaxis protein
MAAMETVPTLPETLPSLADVRVLVVDDNQDAVEIASLALAGAGASLRTALDGVTALSAWETWAPDVLVCDLAIPGMDGYDVLRRIRGRERGTGRHTPAVAVSAHASAEHRRRSGEAGYARHLAKPYATGDLVRAVAEALRGGSRMSEQIVRTGDGEHS